MIEEEFKLSYEKSRPEGTWFGPITRFALIVLLDPRYNVKFIY